MTKESGLNEKSLSRFSASRFTQEHRDGGCLWSTCLYGEKRLTSSIQRFLDMLVRFDADDENLGQIKGGGL